MNNTISIKIITQEDVAAIFDSHADRLFEIVEDAFLKASKGEVLFPDKISQIFDTQTQNRINCMPATLLGNKVAGLKWVSVFPTNAPKGIQNVTGVMLLSEIETGFPIAVIDGTLCTQLRTAAVGCVAAKYWHPKGGNSWIYWSRRRGSDALYTAETSLPIDQNLQSCFPAQCNRRPIHSRI